jgi:membrane-associated protease RseP (regulator of RpoE activity)
MRVAVDLLYFVLLVSSLIFIHESGHFAFAKIFGVKVSRSRSASVRR